MARFIPETVQTIKIRLKNKMLVNLNLTDASAGSDIDILSDMIAKEKYRNQVEIAGMIGLDNLDNRRGDELAEEGRKYNLEKEAAQNATYNELEIYDTDISKIDTAIKTGGANNGDVFLPADDTTSFPATGTLLIGDRDESEYEQKSYVSKLSNGFNLDPLTPLDNDHGSGEPIVLKTVGDRTFAAGHKVKVPAAPGQEKVIFTITSDWTIYDGEEKATGVSIECDEAGIVGNVSAEKITEFEGSSPFSTAIPNNPGSIENGAEAENDDDFRDRIKEQPDAQKKGTRNAVTTALKEATYGSQRVVYTQLFMSANNCEPSIAYIDDGAGFTPEEVTVGIEEINLGAVGGEQFFQLKNFPLTDASLLNLYKNGSTLLVKDTDFYINQYTGEIELVTPLAPAETLQAGISGVDGYVYYTGLLAVAQWKVLGIPEELETKLPDALPFRLGYTAKDFLGATWGNLIEVRVPSQVGVQVQGEATVEEGTNKSEIIQIMTQNILTYINNLGIGETVVLDQIRLSGLKAKGTIKFTISLPTDDTLTGIGLLPRAVASNILIT